MADLGFGLAKSAVQGTLTMVKLAVEEEKKLKKDVQRDLMLISDEFEMMHSVLNVSKDRVTDDVTKTLVRQVRDMALDVEDCIESAVQLDDESNWWRRMLPSCVPAAAPAAALDASVADIELLKARVEAMGHRNLRYSRIGDSGPKPGGEQTHQQAVASATTSDSFVMLRCAAKKQRNHMDLLTLINRKGGEKEDQREVGNKLQVEQEIEEEVAPHSNSSTAATAARQLQVISVLGTRNDLGSMLLEKAYDHPATCNSFTCRAWVKMMHPFNPCEFIRSLLTQFYKNYGPQEKVDALEVITATDALIIEAEFKKQMISTHRYIVVLEDMSTTADWKAVRVYLPDKNNGSCIVVHTQQLGIASLCVGRPHQVSELENLSADHSVYVLFKEDAAGKVAENVADKQQTAREWLAKNKLVGGLRDRLGDDFVGGYGDDVVASVWGLSGVGKSFLVKRSYYGFQLSAGCLYTYGWVDVPHPFNLMELSRSLLSELDPVQRHKMLVEDPILVCREYLHKHRCYIVIDGLQSMEDWDMTKAALGLGTHKGNIFVITTEESVAKHCTSRSGQVTNVTCLDVHHASELLEHKVQLLGRLWPFHPLATEEQRRVIVPKCGGLPKVICAAVDMYDKYAKHMFSNMYDKYAKHMFSTGVWRDNLVSMLEANAALMTESLQDLFAWLHSYFRSCPDFLKPCIFYLTIFPLNHAIRRRRFVRRWIAEGYARDNKESTAEENGEMFLSKLYDLSMTQAPRRWMPLCQVNGFLREYIISRSMEDNLVFALKDHSSKNLQRTGRHLVIEESWDRDKNVFESIDFSRLRSLTVFGEWKQFLISEKMRLLRVLDLEDVSSVLTNGDIEQMVKLLPRLKFLSLRRCRQITHLPDSLGDLKQLQTLDIRGTSVIKLPKSIIKLEKLQYIRAGATVRQYLSRLPLAAEENPSTSSAAPASATVQAVAAAEDPSTSSAAPASATVQAVSAAEDPSMSSAAPTSRPRASLVSCLSKLSTHRRLDDGSRQNGVKVPRGIGRLSNMHTLGVVNINEEGVLEELKNLTQLHKLGVSGMNWNKSRKFFSAISGLIHLRSLSLQVELNEDNQLDCLDGDSREIIGNLQSLKLYGLKRKLPEWTKLYGLKRKLPEWTNELRNVKKLTLQITTLTQDGVYILQSLRLSSLRLFLSEFQHDELQFGSQGSNCVMDFLEISCNSRLQATIKFIRGKTLLFRVLRLRCWGVSSLRLSGLRHVDDLKEVWLSGPYDGAHKQDIKSEVDRHPGEYGGKPILRLEEEPGLSTPWLRSSW